MQLHSMAASWSLSTCSPPKQERKKILHNLSDRHESTSKLDKTSHEKQRPVRDSMSRNNSHYFLSNFRLKTSPLTYHHHTTAFYGQHCANQLGQHNAMSLALGKWRTARAVKIDRIFTFVFVFRYLMNESPL